MEWRHTRWDSAQLVYTALAKVANTSIKSALLESFAPDVSRQNPHDAAVPYVTIKPGRIPVEVPDYLHFAVVRNPFDRFVSFWADKIMGDGMNDGLRGLGFDRGMSFSDAARLAASLPDEETDPHIRSQSFLLLDEDGRLRPDLVLRFERLGHDWETLRSIVERRSGVQLVALPRRRVSEHQSSDGYYDDTTRRLIRERFATDFETLNYERPRVRRRRDPIDTAFERMLAEAPPKPAVLDLTPPTIDRVRALDATDGCYLAPSRHNWLGQLVKFTALERGRIPPEMFDVLVVSAAAAAEREPHRSLVESFTAHDKIVMLEE